MDLIPVGLRVSLSSGAPSNEQDVLCTGWNSIVTTFNPYNYPILIEYSLHGVVYHKAAGLVTLGRVYKNLEYATQTALPNIHMFLRRATQSYHTLHSNHTVIIHTSYTNIICVRTYIYTMRVVCNAVPNNMLCR